MLIRAPASFGSMGTGRTIATAGIISTAIGNASNFFLAYTSPFPPAKEPRLIQGLFYLEKILAGQNEIGYLEVEA